MEANLHQIRYHINQFIYSHGFAPNVTQLSQLLNMDPTPIKQGLQSLADNHALVLHPQTYDIWVAHPFALFPTLFWVKTENKSWWGNCAWCSFGIAHLASSDTMIYTKLKGEEEEITLSIRNGEILDENYVVHFPIPAKQFWNNVIYTCSMMLLFRNEAEVDDWCKRHNKQKGEVLKAKQVWDLAKIWYGNYLDKDFKCKTKDIAQSMFNQVGLTSDFWKL